MRNMFYADIADAEKIDFEEWKNRQIFVRLAERTARLLSPLM